MDEVFIETNLSEWQRRAVAERCGLVIRALNLLRKYKSQFKSITELANSVAEIVGEIEFAAGKVVCIDPSTLLRKSGRYRLLLDAFLYNGGGGGNREDYFSQDPIANHVIDSLRAEILVLKLELRDKILEVEKVTRESCSAEGVAAGGADVNVVVAPMARVVKVLLDLTLASEVFRFDSARQELLHIGRSRRVAVSASELAPYLNYVSSRASE